jgi:hypothetical protein
MLYNYLSDTGLILDIIAIALLAIFSVPTNTLSPDGTTQLMLGVREEEITVNKAKYHRYRKITLASYFMLVIGFLLQLNIVHNLL